MAGDSPALKRQREEVDEEQRILTLTLEAEEERQQLHNLSNKRQNSFSSSSSSSSSSYNHILSFLEEEEEKLTHQDLSSLMVTLQQELSKSDYPIDPLTSSATSEFEAEVVSAASEEEVVDDRERVFRHLLEASDDELGLPSRDEGTSSSSCSVSESLQFSVNGCDGAEDLNLTTFASFDGLWELEDEAANYYALLQSELFMEKDELSLHGFN